MDPRITFTRASTATYYGTQTALAEQNLLTFSQEFENAAWSNTATTETSNTTTAPDGTATADTLAETAVTSIHVTSQSSSVTGVLTLSVFAKPDSGTPFLTIGISSSGTSHSSATFDLSLGTNTQTQVNGGNYTSPSATITAVAQGFYRCTFTVTTTDTATVFRIGLNNTGTPTATNRGFGATYLGVVTNSIYIWGAQLEQRSAATAYTPTTTATVTNYIPVLETAAIDAPRFDYNPITQAALGLLMEEQRTNLLTYSEQFDNAAWVKSNGSITANTVVSPDGTVDADTFTGAAGTSIKRVRQNITTTALGPWTYSIWLKTSTAVSAVLFLSDSSAGGANHVRTTITFSTGSISTATATGTATGAIASVTPAGNGWYRISITGTFVTALTSVWAEVWLDGFTSTASTTSFFLWGAQLEAGAFPTSYIPTVASQVTRSADAASMTGTNFSSWYNGAEGTAYTEAASLATAYLGAIVGFSDGTINNRFSIRGMTASNQATSLGLDSGVTQWSLIFSSQTTAATKFALGYKVDDIAFTRNAATPLTDASALIPVVNQLRIGAEGTGTQGYNGHIRQIVYYPRRLTNSDLQTITA